MQLTLLPAGTKQGKTDESESEQPTQRLHVDVEAHIKSHA
jgi:hypothetical protein